MQTKDYQLKVKALDDSGSFTGYASTYGPPADLVGDIVAPGAFSQAIAQQGRGFPLLWSHNSAEPIGLGRLSDSKDGLVVDGQLVLEDPAAQRAYAHLKAGSIKGISIGYQIPKGQGKAVFQNDGTRLLKEIHLHEVSLVSVPANPKAQITAVKSLGDVRTVLHLLRDRDVTDDSLEDLLEIDRELKRLLVGRDPAQVKAELLGELQQLDAELKQLVAV